MNIRIWLYAFLILKSAALIYSYSNALPVDGALSIGFPFQFLYYTYESAGFWSSMNIRALAADILIIALAALCISLAVVRWGKKAKPGS